MAWIETASGIALPNLLAGSSGVSISTMVDGGRNANGKFIGSVVGDDKLKYELSFAQLSSIEFMNFLKLFDRKQGGKFVQGFRVFDPRINDFRVTEMYVSDRTGRPLTLDSSFRPTRWADVKCSIVEV